MAKTRVQKEDLVKKLETAMKQAASTVFVHFTKVTVAGETTLRRSLEAEQVKYFVAKKSLVRRALSNMGLAHENLVLEGELAIAYNLSSEGDPTKPAGKIHSCAKEIGADKLTILGGIFQGVLKDAAAMREIATIPSIPVLRGMFANIVNSPRARFAIALSEVAKTKQA